MDRWTWSTSNRRRATFNRRHATFNRSPGIKMNFKQTVELYLWILGDSRNETKAANNNIYAQFSDEMALERKKEWNGDSSLAAESKTSKQDQSKTGKLLPVSLKWTGKPEIEVTMKGIQCRERNVKSKLTFGEKLYNWTTGALNKRGKPDTKTIHTTTGAERASAWIIPEMTCSSTSHTKTAYEGISKKTLKASLGPSRYNIKSYLLSSGSSNPKRSSSEPTMYNMEFPYIGIQEQLTCRASSEYTKYLAESSAEGSLKSMAPKRAASCPAVIYAKPANGGIPTGFIPNKILMRSSVHCTKLAEKTNLLITDPQGSWESSLSYTLQAADDEESIVQKEMSSKFKMQYIKTAEVCIPDGTVPKKLLSVSGNKRADEGGREGVNPRLMIQDWTSQEAANGTTSGHYSSAADIAAAAADTAATVCENLRSQSWKSRRNT